MAPFRYCSRSGFSRGTKILEALHHKSSVPNSVQLIERFQLIEKIETETIHADSGCFGFGNLESFGIWTLEFPWGSRWAFGSIATACPCVRTDTSPLSGGLRRWSISVRISRSEPHPTCDRPDRRRGSRFHDVRFRVGCCKMKQPYVPEIRNNRRHRPGLLEFTIIRQADDWNGRTNYPIRRGIDQHSQSSAEKVSR
jgi:hypothetical protein